MSIHLFNDCLSILRRWAWIALLGVAANLAQAQVQGVTDSEILLGFIPDLSGSLASIGGPLRDGVVFATEEINAAGGIHGRKVRLVTEDSGYDTKKAILITQRMLSQEKVFALFDTFGSAIVQATRPLALDRGVPFLFPAAPTDKTYLPYHQLSFGLFAVSDDHMRVTIDYAYSKLGKRRFGFLYQDDETGQTGLRVAEEQLKVHGLSLVERASFKRGDTNLEAQISRLKAANVDVVVLASVLVQSAAAVIEARAQAWPVDMILATGTVDTIIKLGGKAAEGLYGATQYLHTAQPLTPAYKALNERYKARTGHEIQDYMDYGYTSMMLFAEGAKNAGRNLTPQTLSLGLEQVKNFKAVFEGPLISFGPGNHAPPKEAYIMQVRGGKWVVAAGPLGARNK